MAFDAVGNKTSYTDFNGKTTNYTYDALNREVSRTPDASYLTGPITFTYTPTGKRASMTDASGSTTYSYSTRDQLLNKATPQGTLNYSYDLTGNVLSVISSNVNGTNVVYAWDGMNRLASVTDTRTGGVHSYSYDQTSQVASLQYANGVHYDYSYDSRDRTTNLTLNGPSGMLANYAQIFGAGGHESSVTEAAGRSASYAYDSAYRLLTENVTGDPTGTYNGLLSYTLDSVGNRLSLVSTLAALANQSASYDPDDRLAGDTYDTSGNTLTSGVHSYTNQFEDRLAQSDTTVQMAYDGDGNRVVRTEGGSTKRYLVDDLTPTGYPQVTEELLNSSVAAQYSYGLMRISQRRAGVVSYYGYDGGGSVRQLMSNYGTVTDTYTYDAFGNAIAQTGSTVNPFLYRGEEYDSTIGMYYLRARYYRPQVGRFLTQDKHEECTFSCCHNKYLYGDADPVGKKDPSGNEVAITYGQIAEPSAVYTSLLKAGEVAFDVCMLGYAGSSLAIALAYPDMEVTSASVHFCFLSATYKTVDWRNAKDRVPPRPGPRRADPGRCTPEQHAKLQEQVNSLCKVTGGWGCSDGDLCLTLGAKLAAASACLAARLAIEVACYDFSDIGHLEQIGTVSAAVSNCHAVINAKGCFGGQ